MYFASHEPWSLNIDIQDSQPTTVNYEGAPHDFSSLSSSSSSSSGDEQHESTSLILYAESKVRVGFHLAEDNINQILTLDVITAEIRHSYAISKRYDARKFHWVSERKI
jgi:hypothetical protein